jgi:peptidylprolyl isomerase
MKSKIFRKRLTVFVIVFVIFIATMLVYSSMNSRNGSGEDRVLIVTSMGNITIELFDDMPITTGNFKHLVETEYYDGTFFHRVIDGFMIQAGDITGLGLGDPDVPTIKDEFTDHNSNDRGTVAMAKQSDAGGHVVPNSANTQFFINLVNNTQLNTEYSVFGKVVQGMDVVDRIAKVKTDENNKPLEDVRILKAELVG